MKKLLFSALACVAFAGSAFASNEIVNEENMSLNTVKDEIVESSGRPCKVYVWAISPGGERVWKDGDGGTVSYDECGKYKDKFLKDLKEQNFEFTEDDITVIWG